MYMKGILLYFVRIFKKWHPCSSRLACRVSWHTSSFASRYLLACPGHSWGLSFMSNLLTLNIIVEIENIEQIY